MEENKNKGLKLILGIISVAVISIIVIILLVPEKGDITKDVQENQVKKEKLTEIQKDEDRLIDVQIGINHKLSENRSVKLFIESNLPDSTELMVSLEGENIEYFAQDRVKLDKGKAETSWFTDKGESLSTGIYKVDVTLPFARTQPESVKGIIGEKGENLLGENVKSDEMWGNTAKVTKKIEIK